MRDGSTEAPVDSPDSPFRLDVPRVAPCLPDISGLPPPKNLLEAIPMIVPGMTHKRRQGSPARPSGDTIAGSAEILNLSRERRLRRGA